MKEEKNRIMHEIQDIKKQNEKLINPLKIARGKILQMQRQISIYERDIKRAKVIFCNIAGSITVKNIKLEKFMFQISEKQLKDLHQNLENLQLSHDTLVFSNEEVNAPTKVIFYNILLKLRID